jgi:hypothetical protein
MLDKSNTPQIGRSRVKKRITGGLFLIGAGCIFLAAQMDWFYFGGTRYIGSALLALLGALKIIGADGIDDIIKGVTLILIGFWLYASMAHLWGWTFNTSWPFLLIGLGIAKIGGGLLEQRPQSHKENDQ